MNFSLYDVLFPVIYFDLNEMGWLYEKSECRDLYELEIAGADLNVLNKVKFIP